jgi:hypothetical protein
MVLSIAWVAPLQHMKQHVTLGRKPHITQWRGIGAGVGFEPPKGKKTQSPEIH